MWKQTTLAVVAAGLGFAQQPNDYSDAKSWLCRPGQHDACDIDLTTTVVSANGSLNRETWTEDPNAPIDCFYVYPTVSTGFRILVSSLPSTALPSSVSFRA